MRKISAFLCICLILATACSVVYADNGGEEFRLRGYVNGTLRYDASFLDPHDGPGYKYRSVSLSLREGSHVKVLTQARDASGNTWVLAEAAENGRPKRVYLLQKERGGQALINCELASVPMEAYELESSWQCSCYEELTLRYGPGTEYAATGFLMDTQENAWVVLTNGGWALVECTNAYDDGVQDVFYFTRGWVDFGQLIY